MVKILRNPDENDLIKAIEFNLYDYFEEFFVRSRDKFYYKKSNYLFIGKSGISMGIANLVLRTNVPENLVNETINDVFVFFKEENLPFLWITGPLSRPTNIIDLIRKKHKINIIDNPGMAYVLANLPKTRIEFDDFDIIKVDNKQTYQDFMDVIVDSMEGEEWKERIALFLDNHYTLHTSKNTSAFIGYYKGDPVSTSVVHYSQGVAGLYWIVTKKHARRRGYGTAMTYAPIYEAKKRGYNVVILHASEMGFPVYSKIGFEEYCKVKWIAWRPEELRNE